MNGEQLEMWLRDNVTAIEPPISGKVYCKGDRPLQNDTTDGDKEDIVVAVLTGDEGQIQHGSCVVNIYVPDTLAASGAYYKTKQRTIPLSEWAMTVPRLLSKRGDIYFERNGMVLTFQEEVLREHFVSLKMDFWLLNEN